MKIKYDIQKFKVKDGLFRHHFIYRVWKDLYMKNSISCLKLFEGTLTECNKYCKDHNIDLKRTLTI